MDLTRTAFGSWNGGRFMHFGEPIAEERWIQLVRNSHAAGIRTFITADVYGTGDADRLLGTALKGIPRDSYCLVGTVGHDFYDGRRDGAKGFPRFTDSRLRAAPEYSDYLRMATEKSLERCQTDRFDLLLLHNPDIIGYSSDAVWNGMLKLKEAGLTDHLGVAPGPANGFTLDILLCFERFAPILDWAMIILNPFEPWPGSMVLPAAQHHDVKLVTRVVDYGGIFHDDVRPGHTFGPSDHRSYRPPGWVEVGFEKLERLRSIADSHSLTPLQLASLWCLQQPAVETVVPTLIQEVGSGSKSIEDKMLELAQLPERTLNAEELGFIARVGDNRGCMALKGGSPEHTSNPEPDRWSLNDDLIAAGRRWDVVPSRDLVKTHTNAN